MKRTLILIFCFSMITMSCENINSINRYLIEPVKVTGSGYCSPTEIYWAVIQERRWGVRDTIKTFYSLDEAIFFKEICDRSLIASRRIP